MCVLRVCLLYGYGVWPYVLVILAAVMELEAAQSFSIALPELKLFWVSGR
jgi:hypothetical protein